MADPGAGDASPRHSPSELSTVLNTPRAETPEPGPSEPVDTTKFETSPTSSSSTSGERRIEFQPTWPKMIDITRIATVATWKTQRLPGLFLDLHWHIPSRKAFFKLRATLPLTRETGPRNGKTGIYVFIDPERVRQLSIEHDSHETVHGPNTVSLKFVMATPPALVVPNTPYEPKTAAAKQIFDSIRSLASQTCFDVHVKMPSSKLSANLLEELCAVVSSQDVGSLPTQANAAGLYRGQGGRVIEGDTLVELNTSPPPDEAPPGYCEPPSAPSSMAYSGQKRRRRSSSGSSSGSSEEKPSKSMTRSSIQSLLDANLSLLKKHVDDALALHRQQVAKDVAEQVNKAEARILEQIRSEMNGRCDGMQEYFEDMIHEEIAEAEDNVMRNLTEAPLQATLTFPQHPWY